LQLKIHPHTLLLTAVLLLSTISAFAQPTITYTSPGTYTTGTAITTLTPTTTGVAAYNYSIPLPLAGTSSGPSNISFDAAGNFYVANYNNNTVRKYSAAGAFISNYGTGAPALSSPIAIVFDLFGNGYVVNFTGGTVYKYNAAGVYQSTILTGLSNPTGITIDASNNLYISSLNNNSIKKYSTAGGAALLTITTNVSDPTGVAVDAAGNIYSLNSFTGNVSKYNAAGTYQSTIIGSLNGPWAMSLDYADNFYIGDSGNNRIRVYDKAGTLLKTLTGVLDPEGVAVDSKGNIFVASYFGNSVSKFAPTGGYFINAKLPAGLSFNSANGQISGTPTATSPTTTYTITAWNLTGSTPATVSIGVGPAVTTPAAICGAGTVPTMTASGGSLAGGTYNWYTAATGGTLVNNTATYTPALALTTTFYVDYTVGGFSSPRTAVTATINPVVSSPLSGAILSYIFSGDASDISGNLNTGTLQASPTASTGRFGIANSAYSFNGSTQYVTTATQYVNPPTFSISLWFNTTVAGGKLLGFGNQQTGQSGQYDRHLYMNDLGQLYFGIFNVTAQTINTTRAYNDGLWHHVVVTVGAAGSIMYVDNALQVQNAAMTTPETVTGYWRIGYDNVGSWTSQPTNFFFTGKLDDIAIYNRELTAAEVITTNNVNIIGSATPVCAGSPITLIAPSIPGATYSWVDIAIPSNTSATNPATFTSASTGGYTLTVVASGCTSTATVNPIVSAPPVTTFTATSPVAVGAASTVTLTAVAGSTYSFDFAGGTIVTGTGNGPYTISWATAGAKIITVTTTNATGCTATATQTVTVTVPFVFATSSYAFSQQITLKTGSMSLGASTLTNFPVLVYIKEDALKSDNCSTNVKFPTGGSTGYDFAFTTSAGTSELFYEVEKFDASTGTLLAWVQLPSVTNADMNLNFYFGSLTPVHNTSFTNATWSNDYQAVYHFNEGVTTATVLDATGNGRNGAQANTDLGTDQFRYAIDNTGVAISGGAYKFRGDNTLAGASSIIQNAGTPTSITGLFTLSAWVNVTGDINDLDQKVVSNQNNYGYGYKMSVKGASTATMKVETEIRSSTNPASILYNVGTVSTTTTTTPAWHYIQSVFNGTNFINYVDGVSQGTMVAAAPGNANTNLYIGVDYRGVGTAPEHNFYGTMDEVRVSNIVKPVEWVRAEYYNQTNPTTFTTTSANFGLNAANAAAIGGSITYTWTGSASTTAITTAGNWKTPASNNPTATVAPTTAGGTSLLIKGTSEGVTVFPTLTTTATFYGVTLNAGASLNLGGQSLTVGCNVYNSGTITSTTSSITFNGTFTPQLFTINTTAGTAQFGNITVNNTASSGQVKITGGPVDLYNTLTLTNGSLTVDNAGSGALTLKSSATVTARVAEINTAAKSISGNVTVERWFTGGANKRGWRLMSSPVNNSTTLPLTAAATYNFASLQTNLPITGPLGTADGFDRPGTYTANGPTILLYDTPNFYFASPAKISTNVKAGSGFYFYYRGNRTSIATKLVRSAPAAAFPDPELNVVGLQTGTLNQQSFTYTLSNLGRRYNQVGNPYPSSISIGSSALTGTTGFIYTYSTGNSILTQVGPATIASGQGFFVIANATGPSSVTFTEALKVATQPTGPTLLLGVPAGTQTPIISLKMIKDSANYDVTHLRFLDTYKRGYDEMEDADDFNGPGQVVLFGAMTGDDHLVAIASQPFEKQRTSVFLSVNGTASGLYAIQKINLSGIPAVYEVWLMDHFKKDSLDIRANDTYNFNLDKANPETFGNSRFELVIRKKNLPPYQLISFKGLRSGTDVLLNWSTLNEYDYTAFELQKSTDGVTFDAVKNMQSSSQGSYSFKDIYNSSTSANVYYRLKQVDINDAVSYSGIVMVTPAGTSSFSIFPNPASNLIQFSLDEKPHSAVRLRIFNTMGILMKNSTFTSTAGQQDISSLTPGNYTIELTELSSKKLLFTAKFIKI
jgi:hypothetical protein